MNRERLREILKRLRDFILCCKKTIDVVEDVIQESGNCEIIHKNKK